MNDLILYTTEDGRSEIKLRANNQTVWLTQKEMSQLFDVSTDNVGLHLKNLFAERELEEKSVTEESSVTAADGKNYLTKLYNLDAILAVGYRVRSPRGVQFRRWASTILKEATQKPLGNILWGIACQLRGPMQQLFSSPEATPA